MSKCKLVPNEATKEMEQAAESYWNERRFKGLSDDPRTWAGVYQAMLVAAPNVDVLVEALEEIIDPIRFMQGRLEEGEQLNVTVAIQLAKDAEYLRDIAKAALTAYSKGT